MRGREIRVVRSDGMEFDSLTSAANSVDGQASHISECINVDNIKTHKRYHHKGYEWRASNDTVGETKNKENT